MTTLAYVKHQPLPLDQVEHDRKFGAAMRITSSDPARSNAMLLELSATGGYVAAVAHRELSERYKWGNTFPIDARKALEHLLAGVELGSPSTMLMLAAEYARDPIDPPNPDDPFAEAPNLVDHDLDAAIHWCRKAAELDYRPAWIRLAELLRRGRPARECSAEEIAEVKENLLKAGEVYRVGEMYCVDKNDDLCSQEDVAEARRWYLLGHSQGIDSCTKTLEEWGEVEPVKTESPNFDYSNPPPQTGPWTLAEIAMAPFALLVWAIVGSGLLALVIASTSVTFPVIIIGAVCWGVGKWLVKRK